MRAQHLDPLRVENRVHIGTPDVNFIHGWVELKHADRWPPRKGALRLKHPPTPQQKVFLYRRWHEGGIAFLCLRVGKEWFLFKGCDVLGIWQTDPTEDEIRACAVHYEEGPLGIACFLSIYRRNDER